MKIWVYILNHFPIYYWWTWEPLFRVQEGKIDHDWSKIHSYPLIEFGSGFIYNLALGQLKFTLYSSYLTLFSLYHFAGRNTSFAQMFLDTCLTEDFSRCLSRRHCQHHQSVHFCRHCSGLKPFCKSLNLFWMYSFQAFRFYSLALNCLLYSLITFLRRKKKKRKSLSIPLKPQIFFKDSPRKAIISFV